MIDRDRPVRTESGAEGRIELEVAQPHRAQADSLCLDLAADSLDQVVQVQGPVAGVDHRLPYAEGRQLAERLPEGLGYQPRIETERPGQREGPDGEVGPRQHDPAETTRRRDEDCLAGDSVSTVGEMWSMKFKRPERDPGHRRTAERGLDLGRMEAIESNLDSGVLPVPHGRLPSRRGIRR